MLYQLLEVNFILMAWTFNSFSWPKKKEVHLLFASVEFQVSESIFHVRQEHARCRVRVPWYTGIWVGYAATPSQPLLSGCFPRKYTMFRDLGFWVVSPKGGSVSAVWVPGQNVALADDFFDSGRNGDSSESYRLRSFSQAAICKHAMDKMGEAGKIGGKRVLWPFWLMLHLLACRRGAAEWRLRGSCTGSHSASALFLPFWPSPSCLQLLCCCAELYMWDGPKMPCRFFLSYIFQYTLLQNQPATLMEMNFRNR